LIDWKPEGLMGKKPIDDVAFLDEAAQRFIAATRDSLSNPDDVEAALTQVLTDIVAFIGAEEASVFLVDQTTGELVLRYASGAVGRKIVGLRLKWGQGVVGWAIHHGEDLIVPFPGLDTRFFEAVDQSTGFVTHSILCGPIRLKGRTIGAIEVFNKREGTFNDDDLVLLRAISGLVAEVVSAAGGGAGRSMGNGP
jgi:sigma-B regulation protein RsbU (phosphoserine phosphatase)